MNIFRLLGDGMHLLSIFIIFVKIYSSQSCKGISLKTQFLYLLVFLTRYVDLVYNFASMYNWGMKILFIVTSGGVVFLMRFRQPYRDTYDPKADSFNIFYLIIPCAILASVVNEYFSAIELLWTFSVYLEAVAIVPQLVVVHETARQSSGFVENLTSHYVFSLGSYRVCYLLNWAYRIATEPGYRNWIVWVAGLVQTVIYCDFFYYYVKAQYQGTKVVLPV